MLTFCNKTVKDGVEREGWDAVQKRMEDQEKKMELCEQCWVKAEKEKGETGEVFSVKQRTPFHSH